MNNRDLNLYRFVLNCGFKEVDIIPIKNDASFRKYYRIKNKKLIVMDAPPDKGESIEQFRAIADIIHTFDLSAPQIVSFDTKQGFMLLEDFGQTSFSNILNKDNESKLYKKAIEVLIQINKQSKSKEKKISKLKSYSIDLLVNESLLFIDWYLEKRKGELVSSDQKKEFIKILNDFYNNIKPQSSTLVLRDYHVDNLFFLNNQKSLKQVGLIDFQDAVIGSPLYDLASLLEDVRRPLRRNLQKKLLEIYIKAISINGQDAEREMRFFSIQRNLKILGIFCRLSIRDKKDGYLKYLPNAVKLLRKNLQDPFFINLVNWLKQFKNHELI
jgi:aminoglycoside/choline kinase family phosphotransferase